MRPWPPFNIVDGTEQKDRFSRALEPNYFRPDERRFEELLALGIDLGQTVPFFDLTNRAKGTWRDRFRVNEIAVMALILSKDTEQLESEFQESIEKGLKKALRYVYEIAGDINLWLVALGASESSAARQLSERIEVLVRERLVPTLCKLPAIVDHLSEKSESSLDFGKFHSAWSINEIITEADRERGNEERDWRELPLRNDTRKIFAEFLNVVAHLQSLVPAYLGVSLESRRHEPAFALFVVFVALLKRTRYRLNKFSDRHLDFYYRNVLKEKESQHKPDHLFLALEPIEGRREVKVPAGTDFITKAQNGGSEIVFSSAEATVVTDAKVAALCTLRFQRDRYVSPEIELDFVTRIRSRELDVNGGNGESGSGTTAESAWPLFGAGPRLPGDQGATDARVGFLVSSPVLLLREGHRIIEVQVELGDPGDREGYEAVKGLLAGGRQEVLPALLKGVFEISLTTPSGWHRVDRYEISFLDESGKGSRSRLWFRLYIGPEADPIVSYTPEVHGGHWGGSSPLIRFRVNEAAHFYVYSLLKDFRLSAVTIDVHVRGLRDLRLYNNVGQIDPSKPFQPFGPAPTLSSYFAFGSYEMAQKQLTELTLILEWAALPTCFGGFGAHYDGYGREYAEGDFRVDLSVLKNGSWQSQDERQCPALSLFEPTGPTGRLKNDRSISVDIRDLYRPVRGQIAEDQFDLQSGTRNGFFRLQLNEPEGAFGHAEYPMLLAKALSKNIRSKVFGKVPNAPYTPLLSQVQVEYRARARISMEDKGSEERSERDQKIFHLHPFGYEELVPMGSDEACTLLPKYDTDGNLFIGISGHDVRSVSLVFQLAEQTNQQTPFEHPDLIWYYLSTRGWRRLRASSLVSDTTNGLLTSGVIQLVLPADLDTQSTLMAAGKGWLRVGTNRNQDSFPRLITVRANGIRATRRIDTAAGEAFFGNLRSGCEWRTAVSIPGLGAITQVGGSFGGEPKETRRRFVTRVSERLCHKDRPVTTWDYERLILQRFPTLFKVKCFTGLCATQTEPRPGNILIVVVPHTVQGEAPEHQRPMVDVLELRKIKTFVQDISSPFVTVEVRNPLYERIQVRCKVKFPDDPITESYVRKLDHEVSRFLSPWIPTGYRARFGWIIRREQIEGFIRDCDYVDHVTDFSMLQITEDSPDTYSLEDTARKDTADSRSDQVRWRFPWSLAVPMQRHFIHAMPEAAEVSAEPVGIDELEIGHTLIINGNQQP